MLVTENYEKMKFSLVIGMYSVYDDYPHRILLN